MVELLKQPQFSPMSVGEQVITIFAGSSGLLDEISLESIIPFQAAFLQWLVAEHLDYINEISATGKLTDQLAEKLTEALRTFKNLQRAKS
jgi:F-type H+-transporting ATPase subunit alpha